MLDLKGLDTFVWVVRLGGFRAAAERLNTTQPAISARIAQLEEELGVKLFDRDSRRATLTAKGLEALDYAERILALKAELFQAVSDKNAIRGVLRLGVAETIVHTWLSRLVERLHHQHPGITLDIEVDISVHLRERLLSHDLDIALLLGPVGEPRIQNLPLCHYPMSWVASPRLALPTDGPLSIATLAGWPIITFARMTPPHIAVRELFAGKDLPPVRIYGASSLATIIRMTLDGIGISAIPSVVIGAELAENRLRIVEAQASLPGLDFTASYPTKPDSYMAAAVAELAAEVARDHPDSHQ
jgi:DNA-binding transcriptional LysR family regulator